MPNCWQPDCTLEVLRLRAWLLAEIRRFFSLRNVLEVETPLLSHAIGTDPGLAFFTTEYSLLPERQTLFLQTSPEFAMKRLLAAGCGSIFQVCKAFRNGESGRYHHPEFTLLEWYRIDFSLSQLMDEIAELIETLFSGSRALNKVQRFTYHDIFLEYTGLNPLVFSYQDYCDYALKEQLYDAISLCGTDHVLWLDFIFSHKIQPHLGKNTLCMVYGFPACQSSLARINEHNNLITDRVEIFINGIELGNGYYELTDAKEQNSRFDNELSVRRKNKLPVAVKDEKLIAAMESGLPECSGMAIGLDRLLMLLANATSIDGVLGFSLNRS